MSSNKLHSMNSLPPFSLTLSIKEEYLTIFTLFKIIEIRFAGC